MSLKRPTTHLVVVHTLVFQTTPMKVTMSLLATTAFSIRHITVALMLKALYQQQLVTLSKA
jgi:hypothetical protein